MPDELWTEVLDIVQGSWRSFSYSSSVYSCHLFLISSASVRCIPFLSFIEPIFAWNVPLVSLIFLKRSLVFPILLFSSVSLHWSLRKAFLSLLDIQMGLSFLFSFAFHIYCKASSDSQFAFLPFLFLEMVLIHVSCTMSRTSVHSSSGTLSDLVSVITHLEPDILECEVKWALEVSLQTKLVEEMESSWAISNPKRSCC